MSPDMVKLVEVILAGGGGYVIKQAWDWWRDRQRAALPEARHIVQLTHTAQQVDLLAKVNQELEDDLACVRAVLRDTETHSRSSESAWQAREAAWLLELDGQLYRETILRHQLTSGRGAKGPVAVCPTCGGTEITYDRVMDSNLCPACGWTDLPDFPKAFPEDGDKPLLVEAPYDGLYDLYLMSKVDFYNREADNYNNSALAYNAALDEWRKQYHRRHLPIGGGGLTGLF